MKYYDSPVDFILDRATTTPSKYAVIDTIGRSKTYYELLRDASWGAYKLQELGVEAGSKVAVALRNTVDSVTLLYSIWLAGSTAVVIDPLSFAEDIRMQFEESKPNLFIVEDRDRDTLCSTSKEVECTSISRVLSREGETVRETYYRPRAWDEILVFFYAGVVGRTTEVIHTASSTVATAVLTAKHYEFSEEDTIWATPPLSHLMGLGLSLLSSHVVGATSLLYARFKKVEPSEAVELAHKYKPSIIVAAPQLYQILLQGGFKGYKELRFSISGGAPLPKHSLEEWRRRTNTDILQVYGMTEAAPVAGTKLGDNPEGSIGKPVNGVEVKIVDPEDTSRLASGPGELLVRGPIVMKRYHDEEDTARAITSSGWLCTGDIIEEVNGYLYFRGVRKRMIKYKGYPIFPRDLEIVLEKHPAVVKAEVYGENAGEHGQVPVAKVWVERGARVSEKELVEWVNTRVAPYKKIRKIHIEYS